MPCPACGTMCGCPPNPAMTRRAVASYSVGYVNWGRWPLVGHANRGGFPLEAPGTNLANGYQDLHHFSTSPCIPVEPRALSFRRGSNSSDLRAPRETGRSRGWSVREPTEGARRPQKLVGDTPTPPLPLSPVAAELEGNPADPRATYWNSIRTTAEPEHPADQSPRASRRQPDHTYMKLPQVEHVLVGRSRKADRSRGLHVETKSSY